MAPPKTSQAALTRQRLPKRPATSKIPQAGQLVRVACANFAVTAAMSATALTLTASRKAEVHLERRRRGTIGLSAATLQSFFVFHLSFQ